MPLAFFLLDMNVKKIVSPLRKRILFEERMFRFLIVLASDKVYLFFFEIELKS